MSNQIKITAEEIEARYYAKRTTLSWDAWEAYCECLCWNDPQVADAEESYLGEFRDFTRLAEHLVDESGMLHGIPASVADYFDYEKYGNDIRLSGDAWEVNGHFFSNR